MSCKLNMNPYYFVRNMRLWNNHQDKSYKNIYKSSECCRLLSQNVYLIFVSMNFISANDLFACNFFYCCNCLSNMDMFMCFLFHDISFLVIVLKQK